MRRKSPERGIEDRPGFTDRAAARQSKTKQGIVYAFVFSVFACYGGTLLRARTFVILG
jgi:hypothetical protein